MIVRTFLCHASLYAQLYYSLINFFTAVQISLVLTYLYLSPGRVKLFEMHTLVPKYEQSKVNSLFTVKMHI